MLKAVGAYHLPPKVPRDWDGSKEVGSWLDPTQGMCVTLGEGMDTGSQSQHFAASPGLSATAVRGSLHTHTPLRISMEENP